jgi:hypothetical protein
MIEVPDELQAGVRPKEDLERLLEDLSGDASAVLAQAKRLASLEAARLRISVESKIASTLSWTFVLIACATTAALAGIRLMSGLASGIARLTGELWLGDLAGGLIVIAIFGVGGRMFWIRRDKLRLAALQREFAEKSA